MNLLTVKNVITITLLCALGACGQNLDKALLTKKEGASSTNTPPSISNGDGTGDPDPVIPGGGDSGEGGSGVETTTLTALTSGPVGALGAYIPPQVVGLKGKFIAVGAGHGWRGRTASESAGKRLQRSWHWSNGSGVYSSAYTSPVNANAVVEDYINSEITYYLNEYLRNAGAETSLVRELSRQTKEVSVCPGTAGYTEAGGAFNTSANNSAQAGMLCGSSTKYHFVYGDNAGNASFKYTATVPADGMYPVYYHYLDGTDRASSLPVSITHAGGVTRTTANFYARTLVSNAYGAGGLRSRALYLGTYYFKNSLPAEVQFFNEFATDRIAVADTLRIGGGLDSVPIDGTPTNEEKYKSSAFQYQKFLLRPATVARLSSGYNEDVTTRPHAANYESADAFISVHNNATGSGTYPYTSSSGKGTMVIYQYGSGGTYKALDEVSKDMALKVKYRMLEYIRDKWDSSWTNITWGDTGFDGDYGETRVAQVPATLIEVGFFTHPSEVVALSNERFYRIAARGIYMGIAQFFGAGYLPEEVDAVRVKNTAAGEFKLEWDAPASGSAPTFYLVRTSTDGVSFDSGRVAATASATFSNVAAGKVYHFTVQAGNENGLSLRSEVVSIRVPVNVTDKKLLIVNGFDRLDNKVNFVTNYDKRAVGPQVERGNTFNYTPSYLQAIVDSTRPWSVASSANEAVTRGHVNLADFDAVIWYVGRESWSDETVSYAEQQRIETYLSGGGRLIFTGSEIGWDLASQTVGNKHANDVPFLENFLHTRYVGDDAGTSSIKAATGVLTGAPALTLSDGLMGAYQNLFPDYYTPVNSSACVQEYNLSSRCAVLFFTGTYRVFSMGYPFEIITAPAARATLMEKMLLALE